MASTKAPGSNGARSSGPSPRPTSLAGTPSSRCTAMTIPPLAVPSSLVNTMPVTSTTSANTRAWRSPFCPVVASSTSRTSSTVVFFSTTRLTLPSSSISPTLVCRRPAVSMTTTSTPLSVPWLTASKATLAGSAPSRSARTVSAPTRCPHVCNWSAAAARNVSAAPSSTVYPSPISARASFPQVVVLPVPFTPTMRMTAGTPLCGEVRSDRSVSSPSWVSNSPRSSARTSSGPRTPSTLTLVRRSSTISRAGTTPTSAVISTSSISSQVSSSSRSLDSRFSSAEPTELCDLASRARSRTRRPADGGGRSTSSTPVAAAGVSGAAADSASLLPAGVVVARAGGTGAWAGGPPRDRPRRGRTNSSQPPAPSASTAMTMIRITYSIRTPVFQTSGPTVAAGVCGTGPDGSQRAPPPARSDQHELAVAVLLGVRLKLRLRLRLRLPRQVTPQPAPRWPAGPGGPGYGRRDQHHARERDGQADENDQDQEYVVEELHVDHLKSP